MRYILSVFVGVFFAILGMIIIVCYFPSERLFAYCFPPFFGSLVAGYVSKTHGWLLGLIIACIFLSLNLLFLMGIGYGTASMTEAFLAWIESWWIFMSAIIFSIAGGIIGSFFASSRKRTRHLRK